MDFTINLDSSVCYAIIGLIVVIVILKAMKGPR